MLTVQMAVASVSFHSFQHAHIIIHLPEAFSYHACLPPTTFWNRFYSHISPPLWRNHGRKICFSQGEPIHFCLTTLHTQLPSLWTRQTFSIYHLHTETDFYWFLLIPSDLCHYMPSLQGGLTFPYSPLGSPIGGWRNRQTEPRTPHMNRHEQVNRRRSFPETIPTPQIRQLGG